jgi:hypothetical protein
MDPVTFLKAYETAVGMKGRDLNVVVYKYKSDNPNDESIRQAMLERCGYDPWQESRTFGAKPFSFETEKIDPDMRYLIDFYNSSEQNNWSRTGIFGVDVTGKLKRAAAEIKGDVKKAGERIGIGSVDEDPFTTLSKEFVRIALEPAKTLQHLKEANSQLGQVKCKTMLTTLYNRLSKDSGTMKTLGLLGSNTSGHLDASPDRLVVGIKKIVNTFNLSDSTPLDEFVDRYLNSVSHHVFANLSLDTLYGFLVAYKEAFQINM